MDAVTRPIQAADIGDNSETQIETELAAGANVDISETEEMAPLVLGQASDEETQIYQ